MHHPTDRMTHTTVFVTPIVEHWLETGVECYPQNTIRTLIGSIRRHCMACAAAYGGHTHLKLINDCASSVILIHLLLFTIKTIYFSSIFFKIQTFFGGAFSMLFSIDMFHLKLLPIVS